MATLLSPSFLSSELAVYDLCTIFLNVCCRRFAKQAESLGVSPEDLYTALLQDAEVESPNWDLAGRQANIWKELGMC